MRILELTCHFVQEFERIVRDAATPPLDQRDIDADLRSLAEAHNPRTLLRDVPECAGLLELVIDGSTSGHRYGVLFVDMAHVADAIAYWREPPLYADPAEPLPHGYGREHALHLARRRLEDLR